MKYLVFGNKIHIIIVNLIWTRKTCNVWFLLCEQKILVCGRRKVEFYVNSSPLSHGNMHVSSRKSKFLKNNIVTNQFKTIFICFKHLLRGGIEVLRNKWNLGVSWLPSEGERGGERGQFFPEREFSPGSIALQQRTADVSPTIHYYQSRSPIFSLRLFEAISEYLNFSILSNI